MCGRFTLTVSAEEILAEFGPLELGESYERHYNIAPQQPVLVVGRGRDGRSRSGQLRWGLVPWWASDASIGNRLINARSETLTRKPAFREAYASRRCVIVADGFYEWAARDGVKVPYRIRLPDGRPFGFAGLWECWRGGDGPPLYTCTIVTTRAAAAIRELHDRMPVLLDAAARDAWLGSDLTQAAGVLRPYEGELDAYAVSTAVNRVANDRPDLIEPVEPSMR